jgi:hypothetical protein
MSGSMCYPQSQLAPSNPSSPFMAAQAACPCEAFFSGLFVCLSVTAVIDPQSVRPCRSLRLGRRCECALVGGVRACSRKCIFMPIWLAGICRRPERAARKATAAHRAAEGCPPPVRAECGDSRMQHSYRMTLRSCSASLPHITRTRTALTITHEAEPKGRRPRARRMYVECATSSKKAVCTNERPFSTLRRTWVLT